MSTNEHMMTTSALLTAALAWYKAQGWAGRTPHALDPEHDLVMAIRGEGDDPVLRAMREAPIVEGDAAEQEAEAVGLRSIDARDIVPEDQRAMIRILPGEHDPRGLGVGAHDMPDGGPCSCGAWHKPVAPTVPAELARLLPLLPGALASLPGSYAPESIEGQALAIVLPAVRLLLAQQERRRAIGDAAGIAVAALERMSARVAELEAERADVTARPFAALQAAGFEVAPTAAGATGHWTCTTCGEHGTRADLADDGKGPVCPQCRQARHLCFHGAGAELTNEEIARATVEGAVLEALLDWHEGRIGEAALMDAAAALARARTGGRRA